MARLRNVTSFADKEPSRTFLWFFGPVVDEFNPKKTTMQVYRAYLRVWGRPPDSTGWRYPDQPSKRRR